MKENAGVVFGILGDTVCHKAIQRSGHEAHADDNRRTEGAIPKQLGGGVQFIQSRIHFFLKESAFVCQADVSARLFKELDAAQVVFQIVDGGTQTRLGNAQTCGGDGIVFHLGQNGEVSQRIVVHMEIFQSCKDLTIGSRNRTANPGYCLEMAPNLQVEMQAPHLTHFAASISSAGFFLPGAV